MVVNIHNELQRVQIISFGDMMKSTQSPHTFVSGENLENEKKLYDQAVAKGIHIFTFTEFFRFLGTRFGLNCLLRLNQARNPTIDVDVLLQPEFHHQISFDRESVRKYSLEISPNGKSK